MTKLSRILLFIALQAAARLGAQVAGPSPLVDPEAVQATIPGGWIAAEHRANSALETGFPATAATIYRELLGDVSIPPDTRQRIRLGRVTALLDAGELPEAEKELQAYDGPRNTAYQLRAGLIAANTRRFAQAKAALAAGKVDELPAVDRGWWYFLQAAVAESDNDIDRRNKAYEEANQAAVSELQRARFALGQEQARLRSGQLTEQQLKVLRDNMDRFQGSRTGYDYLRTYAAALDALGRGAEAQNLLQRQLLIMPSSERNVTDQLRLVLGLIAGERSVAGQQAFRQLLRDGQRPETQRLALQLLARGAKTPVDREQLRRDLTELIVAPVQHQIIEDLLLVRAQTALADQLYAPAEEDARALINRYPGSALKARALGLQLSVAWDLKRYRTAADLIAQLRPMLAGGRDRSELGVLLAEAFFRAEDYKNAADAYDAALRELPVVVPAGDLIFQLVLSDIRADQLSVAAKQLDEFASNPAFDPVNRWQAEWNLIRKMQVNGQTQAAYVRVTKLLPSGAEGVPESLRIRLLWLRAKLSFDNSQPETTLRQVDELLASVQQGGQLDATLRTNVISMAELLKAQALLSLPNQDKEGFALLDKLRADYRTSSAAQYSYLVQAGYLTQRGDLAGSQSVLLTFVEADEYKHSEYAPLALYEAALNLDRQGLDRQLREAYRRLEQLVNNYPGNEMVFYARLKQGDLMRKLNEFTTARQFYEDLINNYGQHPDVLLAQLALADTLFALGNNPVNLDQAINKLERLRDLTSAPVDLRAEAGFKWGIALYKRSQAATTPAERELQSVRAQGVLWSVVDAFLLDPAQAEKLGAKGRWWISRALLELGQMHEEAGRLDEAQRAYQLIVDTKLGGAAQAQEKLARYRTAGTAKP